MHRASGLWFWPLLFLLALTSLAVSLENEVFRPVLSALLPTTDQPRPSEGVPDGTHLIAFDEAVAYAQAEAWRRYWDAAPTVAYVVRDAHYYGVRFGDPLASAFGASTVLLSSADGRILDVREADAGQSGDLVAQLMLPIHTGQVAGLPGRILICITGLVVAMLSITGIYIWWKKRASRLVRRLGRKRTVPQSVVPSGGVGAAE